MNWNGLELPNKPREILKLVRFDDGRFGIYADGELVEVYSAEPDTWQAMIPIRLWRTFNKIVESRINKMEIQHSHTCGESKGYNHSHKRGNIPHGHHGSRYGGKV